MIAAENLVGNAVKFGNGAVLISGQQSSDGKLVIDVADDGDGFSADADRELLEAFSQGDSGLTRESTGLGLGLTTANMVIELHGGSVELERSAELGGARVRINLYTSAAVSRPTPPLGGYSKQSPSR